MQYKVSFLFLQSSAEEKRVGLFAFIVMWLHVYVYLHRGSYMSAHVLLNLLNEFEKRDKMRGLPSIFISFSQRV